MENSRKHPANATGKYIGQPTDRVDGFAKVTGRAKYAAEYFADDLHYGVVYSSEIAKGRVVAIRTEKAAAADGVIGVLTHRNRPSLAWFNKKYNDSDAPPGWHFRALYDDEVRYSGQPLALVVAKTFEQARYAASLIETEYESEEPVTDLLAKIDEAYDVKKGKSGYEKPKSRGDAAKAFGEAEYRIEADYLHPMEHHNPMEMHASTVILEKDGTFTIADKTQGVENSQTFVCNVFGFKPDQVRVLAPYVGGAFGSGLRPQYQLMLAMMAAIQYKKSIRVVLTRQQMFSFGHRPAALQTLRLGADASGLLEALDHTVIQETSQFEDYTENIVNWSGSLYKCADVHLGHKLVKLDTYTPLDMRAPGAVTGLFALESAMDELAAETKSDPLELRLANYSDSDLAHFGRPYSSKELRACYGAASEKFGWKSRSREPGSMRDGKKRIGWGVATGVWDAQHVKLKAAVELSDDGQLKVLSAMTDIGTGTYTIVAQIAAEYLGVDIKDVSVELGRTDLPTGTLQGGSWTAASLGAATQNACETLAENLFKLAKNFPDSPFEKAKFSDVRLDNGKMFIAEEPSRSIALNRILKLAEKQSLRGDGATAPNPIKEMPFARLTHSAIFAEVRIDEDHGMIEVPRVVSAIAAGRILNPKTARSQILGGVVMGISQALHEHSMTDHRLGRIMNHNFAEYHIPVNKDIHDIEVIFVPEEDSVVSPLGVKGLGEIGIVGTAAAIANAVYHATGKRIRELPITPDKLI